MRKGILRVAIAALLICASVPLVANTARAAGCGTPGQPTRTLYLPNITKTLGGAGGWYTPFIVQNVGVASTDLEVSFFRFSDGTLVTCRRVSGLAPFRSFADVPNNDVDLPADSQFAVVVRSFGADVIAVVNEHQGSGPTAEALSYVGLASGAQSLALPYVAKNASGWIVRFVVQNLGTLTANVTARFVSLDGSKTATLTRAIAPGASRFVDPTIEPALLTGAEYSVTLTSDQPIAAIANAHNDAPGAIAPMGFSYNAVATSAPDTSYVASVARNVDGARTTRVVVQNAGSADAAPTLLFRRPGVSAVTATGPQVAAGRSWSFDSSTLPDGDWSLQVSGGQFAVLAVTTNATSAYGYTGVTAPGNRAYLPNVTRTLGGPDGWTTPILLQSAGAVSATLRWYRFADGALITRQVVTGLSAGAAVRIDPRSVPGLSDDTQYSVVVDAQGGNVAATVLELNFQGGDGAMAYEGFRATVATTPAPTMIQVSSPKPLVYSGAHVQLAALVKDQFDNVMATPLTWSVAPAALGTVSPSGVFTAGDGASGNATLTATAGTLSASVVVAVGPRPLTTVGGITFALDGSGLADVYTEITITPADAATLDAQVDLDIGQIQSDYAQVFASRPGVLIFGSQSSYGIGLQTIFHYDASLAQQYAATTAGLFQTTENEVVIDWSKVRGTQPLSAARHELTHMMEAQIDDEMGLPAWFNEGNARLEELTVAGSGWLGMSATYGSASMAATGTLLSFPDMTSQSVWNGRPGLAGDYEYNEAAEAVKELRARVGLSGMLLILRLIGNGSTFDAAYAQVAGEPFDVFANSFAARVRALSPSYPNIATAADTPSGPGLSLMFYGFAPFSLLSYSISGPGSRASNTMIVSQFGTYRTFLGNDWPAGSYTITAVDGAQSVTITAVKQAVPGPSFGP